jgi:glycosyltransferase involved in cell wall biosynthesis
VDLSVIIPTFDRAKVLGLTLEAFLRLDTKDITWELLVVDNNSTDGTADVVRSAVGRLPIRCLIEPEQGKNRALNQALKVATGDILVFADDDITPESNWLQEIRAACGRWPNHDVFGGQILPLFPANAPQYLQYSDYSAYVYARHAPNQPEGTYVGDETPGGPNCWLRRRLILEGWRYDVGIGPKGCGRISGSELELFTRLKAAGHQPVYVPAARVEHRIQRYQTTVAYLLKRSFASGRGIIRIFGLPKAVPRILGIPRYMYRQFLSHAARACCRLIVLNLKQAFEELMHCSVVLGSIHESRASLTHLTRVRG